MTLRIVSVSGGKDSTALYLWAKENLRMTAHICPICHAPVYRDPVLFRLEKVHKLCQLLEESRSNKAARESLFSRLASVSDAVVEPDDEFFVDVKTDAL